MKVQNIAAIKIASIFGVLGGIGGGIHGVGEVLQGNITPLSMFFSSWTQGPIAMYLDGDPALSLIQNMLVTGIITLIISAICIIYSTGIYINKCSGKLLIALSVIMLLVGGGVGPPILVLLAGFAALGIHSSYLWWQKHLHGQLGNLLAMLWPWIFTVCTLNGMFLVIGHVIAVYFFAPVRADIFQYSFLFPVFSVLLSIITGIAYDISKQEENLSNS